MLGSKRAAWKRWGIPVLVVALAALMPLSGASSASAASSCGGSLIDSRNLVVHGSKVGELDVYYSRASGRNCAKMLHAGRTWGKRRSTMVVLKRLQRWAGPGWMTSATRLDVGNYRYYAGPVSVAARGHCIEAEGMITVGGVSRWISTGIGHCGR